MLKKFQVDMNPASTQIIGSNGFVGSNLSNQIIKAHQISRTNIDTLGDSFFDLTICAAAPAEKWKANSDPKGDKANLEDLLSNISRVKTKNFVLISTIDVFPHGSTANELTYPEAPPTDYGKNRLWFEEQISRLFSNILILRLPGLFGPGLKKNIIFDAMNNNFQEKVNGTSKFQWYDVRDLSFHINKALKNNLSVVHLATEPIETKMLFEKIFPNKLEWLTNDESTAISYCFQSIYSKIISNSESKYLYDAVEVLNKISDWVSSE